MLEFLLLHADEIGLLLIPNQRFWMDAFMQDGYVCYYLQGRDVCRDGRTLVTCASSRPLGLYSFNYSDLYVLLENGRIYTVIDGFTRVTQAQETTFTEEMTVTDFFLRPEDPSPPPVVI